MYANYGHTLTMVVFLAILHKQANYDDSYNEINQQMSLISGKRMQCLLEEDLKYYNGYHIPKSWAYVNHGDIS